PGAAHRHGVHHAATILVAQGPPAATFLVAEEASVMTAGPRVAPLPPPHPPEIAEDLRKLMPPGVVPLRLFTTVAHNPRVLGRLRRGGLLDPGAISVREREIVILRTTALCGCDYEWGVHVRFFGGAARFTPAEIAATVTGRREAFPPAERPLLAMCDA